jgi:hypothetical protein
MNAIAFTPGDDVEKAFTGSSAEGCRGRAAQLHLPWHGLPINYTKQLPLLFLESAKRPA